MAASSLEVAMSGPSSRPSSGIASPPARSRSRTQSLSSDRPSTIGQHSLMSPPLSVSPEAAFIARSAASQIISNDHDGHADTWYDQHGIELSGESAAVSDSALHLINNFLDQLLFNFLSLAGSTTLAALRPAVSEVLKPKLAKDAINQADEELREYLGGGDDDEMLQGPTIAAKDWDLELVWKRTRLRCMVYSSLGDLEEEDEDYHMQEESLELGDEMLGETVSPAVAIFLTSILEFMGEQALIVAGQAAYHRMRVKHEKEVKEGRKTPGSASDPIHVEDVDMERIALDRTLGRLWRAWKKRIRSPGFGNMDHFQRPRSRESNQISQLSHYRQVSMDPESSIPQAVEERPDEHAEPEAVGQPAQGEEAPQPTEKSTEPAAVPLPIGENDVAEIEVPGLVSYSDDEEDDEVDAEPRTARPKSMMVFPRQRKAELPTPTESQPDSPVYLPKKRSNSLPTPAASPYKPTADRELLVPANLTITTEVEQDEPEKVPAEDLARDDKSRTNEAPPIPKRLSAVVNSITVTEPDAASDSEAELSDHDDGDDTIEFEEEPQILTSSRISISGGSNSPTSSERGRSSMPLSPLHLVRSGSMHSLRLVEVASPRSPATRSHGSFTYEPEPGAPNRSLNPSRTSSITTPPPIEEEVQDPDRGSRSLKMTPAECISENEDMEEPASAVSTSPHATEPRLAPVEKPKPEEASRQFNEPRLQPVLGSVVGHTSSPRSPVKAKVTVSEPTTCNSTFFFDDDKPQVPAKPTLDTSFHAPAVPERNWKRQSQIPAQAPPLPQASSIGNVSVERPVADRRDSPELPLPSPDQQHGRHLHTSGSSTSSGNSKMKTMRGSQESSRTRPEVVARNFEELIQSDQTIQYTLTPESMRDMDSKSLSDGSPLMPTKSRKSEDTRLANSSRSRSSSVAKPLERKRSVSISRAAGLSSHPVEPSQPSSKLNGPVPRAPPVSMQNRLRGSGPQARDARVPRESLADFAEFIRATGPPEEPRAAPAARRVVQSASGPLSSSTPKASIDSARRPNTTASSRQRLQARGAAVDSKDDNSDLIDFIRRGPPDAAGNPRIPRTVAPFRTTMDSDQMTSAVGGRAVDATIPDLRYSQASTNVTDASMPSVQSSANSQTALLGRNKPLPNHTPNQFEADSGMPKRKTRRVRDPYAIDLSDEEEDDLFDELPKRRPPPKEESLMDFLRDAPPPPVTAPVPFNLPQAQAKPVPKKKASATSLISRFARHGSSGNNSLKGQVMATRPATSTPDSRAPMSRQGSIRGHVPIQPSLPRAPTAPVVPSGRTRAGSAYGPSSSTSSYMGGPNVAAGGQPAQRVLMKKYQPREPAAGVSEEVSDLADFLRNSEPPPSNNNVVPFALSNRDEPSSFSRVFARRKKSFLA